MLAHIQDAQHIEHPFSSTLSGLPPNLAEAAKRIASMDPADLTRDREAVKAELQAVSVMQQPLNDWLQNQI